MKTIFIHNENTNPYLTQMFWSPLVDYAKARGWDIGFVEDPNNHRNNIIMVHGDRLSAERISQIKNNGNLLVCWDVNDSSYLSSAYIHCQEKQDIDLIFKLSGIPKRNEISEINIDRNFNFVVSEERYLPHDQWCEFNDLRILNKLRPLPYVLWHQQNKESRHAPDFNSRSGRVLVRGGNHFWRVILFLRLLEAKLLDYRSSFITAPYFSDTMEKRFQYCDGCRSERNAHGKALFDASLRPSECTNPATCWHMEGEFFGGPLYGKHEHGWWNNRCPHSYFHLAKEFMRCRNPLDTQMVERALNGNHCPPHEFFNDLSHASYAADLKWLNTINLPPRFWEAASVGTPSLYLKRVADQDYWPHVQEDVHYFTYPEDLSEFPMSRITEAHWRDVSAASRSLYETKIKGTHHAVSDALLEYMLGEIERIAS